MRARELRGRVVLDVSSARELCRIEAVILDPAEARVVGFRVTGDNPVLPLAEVRALGADAVTVDGPEALHQASTTQETRATEGKLDPLDHLVLGEDGAELGRLDDLDIEADGGAVRTVLLGDRDLPGDRLCGIGDYAVVVHSDRVG